MGYHQTEVCMNNLIFNTIATLVRLSMMLLGDEEVEEIKDNEEVVALAEEFLSSVDRNDDISSYYESIIKECKNRKDYYFVRAVICSLELSVDVREVVKKYDFNTMNISVNVRKSFEGLNSNISETGIIILPQVDTLRARRKYPNDAGEYSVRKNANDWLEDINTRLRQVYYIDKAKLSGYTIKNYLFAEPVVSRNDDNFIRIGMSPILNKRPDDLFEMDYYFGTTSNGLHSTRLFGIRNLLFKELINKKTKLAYDKACAEKCDIFISPEMLGTDELSFVDDEASKLFRPRQDNMYETPFLTLPPTQWGNKNNILSVFDKYGEKIDEQHKQIRFKYHKDNADWSEDLQSSKKEILLIHIEGWGRFAFPICVDFLDEAYRSILIKEIKATFLLCPSFSEGAYNFDLAMGNDSEFEARTVWLNSCSAYTHDEKLVGEIAIPTCLDRSRRTKIERKCEGECKDICLFVVDIPKDCNDKKREVKVTHIYESQ